MSGQGTGWWIDWSGLFESEIAAFRARSVEPKIIFQQNGRLIIEVKWPSKVGTLTLEIGYSPLHPFFRPAVRAPDLTLARHQNELNQCLCLITQASGEWDPSQRVADFIAEQLDQVLLANEARDEGRLEAAAQIEENAPDPLMPYYMNAAAPGFSVFFSSGVTAPPKGAGVALFSVRDSQVLKGVHEAVLERTLRVQGQWFSKTYAPLGPSFGGQKVEGRWVRMRPPPTDNPEKILLAAEAAISTAFPLHQAGKKLAALGQAEFAITGIVFEEELAYHKGQVGDGWLFIVSDNDPATKARRHRLVRGYRVPDDLQVRVPVAAALAGKTVLVLGTGALGSFVAIELARAGVASVTLVDSDALEAGNSVRWPLGKPYWGLPKVWALAQFIAVNYPATSVHPEVWRIGAADAQKPAEGYYHADDAERLRDLIAAADAVIDASASTECQQAVAYFCRKLVKPLVIGYATEGAAGGVVARFAGDSAACFVCLNDHWKDEGFPLPAVVEAGTIVPLGCNQPTFTGGSFDLQEVSLEIVRSAVGLLAPDAYDAGDWQVAVLSHFDGGARRLPNWRGVSLSPRCSDCVTV